MGLTRFRVDSVAALRAQKGRAQLQAENEQLKQQVEALEWQLTDTQLALCDVFELCAALTEGGAADG